MKFEYDKFGDAPSFPLIWSANARSTTNSVETLSLRDGFDVVLSQIAGGDCEFHYEEPDDVFGFGFHLRGGARFVMEGERFETKPLEVWAGAAPRGSVSKFNLPAHGFRTVSLRFSPDVIRDLLDRHELQASGLLSSIASATRLEAAFVRLGTLDPNSVKLVDAMFTSPFSGLARQLHLESCALGLLASQIDAAERSRTARREMASARQLRRARDLLDENLEAPPSILQLARLVGMNDFKLKRDFKSAFGTTIFGYVRQRRMERAAAQLHAGSSVGAAAHAAGYVCPRCFSDAFRRHFGVLPSEVTRSVVAKSPAHHS